MTPIATTTSDLDQIWSDEALEALRSIGDPLVDDLVTREMAAGTLKETSRIMRQMITNNAPIPADLPPAVRTYFQETTVLPDGIDWEKIELAQKIYRLYALEIAFLLTYASLPGTYLAKKGVQALILTERLSKQKQAYNRLFETGQFVIDAMSPGGFEPDGKAIRSAQKVRMVHAVVRYHIDAKKEQIWDDEWGIPANQEDSLGTLFAFSVAVLEGLKKIGVFLTDYEEEAFYHLWWVMGHLLGIDPAVIPTDLATATAVSVRIRDRHFEETEEGKELTRVILNILEAQAINPRFKKMPHALMRYVLGDEYGDMLGVDKPERWQETLVRVRFGVLELADGMRYSQNWVERSLGRMGREVLGRMGYGFLIGFNALTQAGQGTQFSLPDRLRDTRTLGPMATSILQAGQAALDRQFKRPTS